MTTNPRSLAFDNENKRLLCEICMEWTPFDELYVDGDGIKWDVCNECGEAERKEHT